MIIDKLSVLCSPAKWFLLKTWTENTERGDMQTWEIFAMICWWYEVYVLSGLVTFYCLLLFKGNQSWHVFVRLWLNSPYMSSRCLFLHSLYVFAHTHLTLASVSSNRSNNDTKCYEQSWCDWLSSFSCSCQRFALFQESLLAWQNVSKAWWVLMCNF